MCSSTFINYIRDPFIRNKVIGWLDKATKAFEEKKATMMTVLVFVMPDSILANILW